MFSRKKKIVFLPLPCPNCANQKRTRWYKVSISTQDGQMHKIVVTQARNAADAITSVGAIASPFFIVRDVNLIE